METGMLMIAAVFFAVILIPILLLIQNTKKQSKRLFNELKATVANNNGLLTQHTEQNNFALGIDNVHKTIYFLKMTETGKTSEVIDLSLVKTCAMNTTTRRIKKEKGFEELIEKIELLFIFKNNNHTKHIELYNEAESLLNNELTIGKQWRKIVEDIISEKHTISIQKNDRKNIGAVA